MVFVETLDGVEKALRPKGYQMLLGVSNYSSEEEDALVRAYLAFDPDGILLTGMNYRESTRRLLEQVRVPVVHMMELSDRDEVYSVGFDGVKLKLKSSAGSAVKFVSSSVPATATCYAILGAMLYLAYLDYNAGG